MGMERCDVAIVGAGPYGLSAAAHLRQVKGLEVRLFGEPMSFWETYMPEGMYLRSPWEASHIADPDTAWSLNYYRELNGNSHLAQPLPRREFVKYGRWFYERIGISANPRKVMRIEPAGGRFQLILDDGQTHEAGRVVVAAGIQPFAHRPSMFDGLPAELVTHSSEHRDFTKFRGKEILVIGGGQSAIETAALLSEAGASVEVLVRKPAVNWLGRHPWLHAKGISWMFYGRGDVGPAGVSLLVQRPNLFRRLPRRIQSVWGTRAVRPAAARWLRHRTMDIPIHTNRSVNGVRVAGSWLSVRLNNGTARIVDHVILGTGYRMNIAFYPFLPPELVCSIHTAEGYPCLGPGFESSLPGLHFIGAPAAWSFGPLMKFVDGTGFASRELTSRIFKAARLPKVFRAPGRARLGVPAWTPGSIDQGDGYPK